VHLTRLTQVDEFLAQAGAFLEAREAEHNLILGICSRLVTSPTRFGEDPYFSVVRQDDAVVAAVIRTPPHNPVLSEVDDGAAIELVVHDLLDEFGTLPGVLGPVAASAAFAATVEDEPASRPIGP
jgi:hypothetical protein